MRHAVRSLARGLASRPRLLAAVALSVVAWRLIPRGMTSEARLVAAWDAGALAYLVSVGAMFVLQRDDRIARDAARQQDGEWTIFAITLAGIVFSFAAIISEFSGSKDLPAGVKGRHIALVAATLFLSWLVTQVVFALRYAHEYYSSAPGGTEPEGGLQFPGDEPPDYLDFMYFALVLGMTFQVSDVQVTSRKLRRLAALHGLLGFVFNTIIIALTVNIAAGLL